LPLVAAFGLSPHRITAESIGTDVARVRAYGAGSARPGSDKKDVVGMRTTLPRAPQRRARPAGPSCRGGASSLLRLTPLAGTRLPANGDLTGWMARAAAALAPNEA
jgi:hypothetical protein